MAVLLAASDIHYGKLTPEYDHEICSQRLRTVLSRLHDRCPEDSLNHDLIIALLGDVNDGSEIYANQLHYQAISNVEQQADEFAVVFSEMLVSIRNRWKSIRVECVAGNHGRLSKRAHEAANWDIVAYRYTKLMLESSGIQVRIPEPRENPFLREIEVSGRRFTLYHGHEIRSWGSIPWYGILTRTLRWYSLHQWDRVIMGHFHVLGSWKINTIDLFVTGTPVTGDEWSMRTLGWAPVNAWWMLGLNDRGDLIWMVPVPLV